MNSNNLRKLYKTKDWMITLEGSVREGKIDADAYASASADLEAEITKEIQHLARRRHRRKLIKKGKLKPYEKLVY